MFTSRALMCVEWLSAVKESHNCTASERARKVTTPKGPAIQEKILTQREMQ